jgi:hypothetical protein
MTPNLRSTQPHTINRPPIPLYKGGQGRHIEREVDILLWLVWVLVVLLVLLACYHYHGV